jgi:predicted DNA-binding transcriptional regulator AlpA
MSELRLLTERDVRDRLRVSRSTFWRMRVRGEFPEPFELPHGRKRWTEATYAQYLASLGAEVTNPLSAPSAAEDEEGAR